MADTDDKRLPATQKKLDRAREEGQIPRSRDLANFLSLAGGGVMLSMLAPWMLESARSLLELGLRFDHGILQSEHSAISRLGELTIRWLVVAVPLGLLMAVLGAVAGGIVGGWNLSWKAAAPTWSRINPLSGLGRMFQKEQWVQTAKTVALVAVIAAVAIHHLKSNAQAFADLMGLDERSALATLGWQLFEGLGWLVAVMGLVALIDAPLQKFFYAKRMRMSFQEVKQEFKDAEGNQEVKGKLKVKMRESSRRRMMAAVPKADLIIMNPSHYAVALQYDEGKMGAPIVLAKGADLLAMAIRDLGKAHQVPVLQCPPLARALYVHAEIDREVPAALFAAVAQVLAWVYQLKAAMKGEGPMPLDLGAIQVPPGMDPLEGES